MSQNLLADGISRARDTSDDYSSHFGKLGKILTLILAVVLVACLMVYGYYYRRNIGGWLSSVPGAGAFLVASIILAALPAAICVAQTVTRRRLIEKLKSAAELRISETAYFISARKSFESIVPAAINNDYLIPLLLNVVLNFFLFVVILNGLLFTDFLAQPNVLLVGVVPSGSGASNLSTYQAETFSVMTAAFLGNYIYTLSQLLSRVNNNDLFPISLHFYSARSVIAMVAACIARHAIGVLGGGDADWVLLLGFVIGMAPDLFIVAFSRAVFQRMKIWGSRGPPKETMPTSLELLEIDDLRRDKIDRLSELGIDSAHALSRQNPFVIWAKLPYDLGLVIDWIGQAQLYAFVRDATLAKLRNLMITDIFDFTYRLSGDHSAMVMTAVGLDGCNPAMLLMQIENDEAYQRLLEVRKALLPKNYLLAKSSIAAA